MQQEIDKIITELQSGDINKDETISKLLLLYNHTLPNHIDADTEAKKYADEMNQITITPNQFHQLDFYNGTVWFRQQIEESKKELLQKNARCSLLLTNQKLWDMAKTIVDKQKSAKEQSTDNVDWNMLQDLWFDWLEEELFGK